MGDSAAALGEPAHGVGALRARAKGTVDAGGVFYKPGIVYTSAHAWVKRLWGGQVRVGLDDPLGHGTLIALDAAAFTPK